MPDETTVTVLLVDDDDDTRDAMRRVLETRGYAVLEAEGAQPAVDLGRGHSDEIDVVVLDVVMPGSSGISVADELAEVLDPLRVLYVSGYIANELPERHETPGRSGFLRKPFTVEEFLESIEELLQLD